MPDVRAAHLALLTRWRTAMNLVGPGPLEPHFEDSEAAVGTFSARGRWADLGSGAGFPGVALAAAHPRAEVSLVESRNKRAAFLAQVRSATGLTNLHVLCLRVEDLPAAAWDGVISRAFAPPPLFLQHAARLLVPGGLAVLMLAREEAPTVPGFALEREVAYAIEGKTRRVVVLRKG
ncbi:MAG: RsmG family class I SAM-dependent methyltransferase [Pseudomonadota bacterium]